MRCLMMLIMTGLAILVFADPSIAGQHLVDGTKSTVPLSVIHFKATHNSYQQAHSPQVQMDEYNVWEIELDFGVTGDERGFVVGHDGMEPAHGLETLYDWTDNVLSSVSLQNHPVILKLEAKTKASCNPPPHSGRFVCVDRWPADWLKRLRDSLAVWIGESNWVTPLILDKQYQTVWPGVSDLAGKVIVVLQDNNDDRDIRRSEFDFARYFFIRDIPGLQSTWPPIDDASEFGRAVRRNDNRLTMDKAYVRPWSNALVHPPLPGKVDPNHHGWQWGTEAHPYVKDSFRKNALRLIVPSGSAPDSIEGTRQTGVSVVSYTVVLWVRDEVNAGTEDSVFITLQGAQRESTGEICLSNPANDLVRACIEEYWFDAVDIGRPISCSVRVAGEDDLALDKIWLVSSRYGRYEGEAGWIGKDHKNPFSSDLIAF